MFVKRINHLCGDSCDYYKSSVFEIGTVYCKNILEAKRYCVNCIESYDLSSTRKIDGMKVVLTGCESQCNFCDADLKRNNRFSFADAREYNVVYKEVRGLICSGCFRENYYHNKSSYDHIENYKLTYDKISFYKEICNGNNSFCFDCVDCDEKHKLIFQGEINCCDLHEENYLPITKDDYSDDDYSDDDHRRGWY